MIKILGSPHEELGDIKQNLILKTAGKIRVQIGKKFIDLLDSNGNLNVKVQNIINKIESSSEINKDGFYYLNGSLLVSIDGKQTILASDTENTYVSFLTKQEATEEQKYQALQNIGIIYSSLEDAKSIVGGIVYVESDKSLYIFNEGNLQKYYAEIPNPYPKRFVIDKTDLKENGALVIKGQGITNGLYFDTLTIYSDNNTYFNSQKDYIFNIKNNKCVKISLSGIETDKIQSAQASEQQGFRLYNREGESTLEVDNLIVRNGFNTTSNNLVPVRYYGKENIILNIEKSEENHFKCNLKYPSEYVQNDKIEIFIGDSLESVILTVNSSEEKSIIVSCDVDISHYFNLFCNLIESNNIKNNNLIIGKIKNNYNNSQYGIVSKQNILYSSKFESSNQASNKINYPFYSEQLYNDLTDNYENLDFVIPPIGIIKKLFPFQVGYYWSSQMKSKKPVNPTFIGVSRDKFIVSQEQPYLWYSNDGEVWDLIDSYINPIKDKLYIISSTLGSYRDLNTGSSYSFPVGFIGYSINGTSKTIGYGTSNYIDYQQQPIEDIDYSVFDKLTEYDLSVIPELEGFLYCWSIDKNADKKNPLNWKLEKSLGQANNIIYEIVSDWGNASNIPGYKVVEINPETNKIINITPDNYISGVGNLTNWNNDIWRKSFLRNILIDFLNKNNNRYSENTGWAFNYSGVFTCTGYGGVWHARSGSIKPPSSDDPDSIGYKPSSILSNMSGYTIGNKYLVQFEFTNVALGNKMTNLKIASSQAQVGNVVTSKKSIWDVDYEKYRIVITQLEDNNIIIK